MKSSHLTSLSAALAVLTVLTAPAFAQTGKEGRFTIHNDTKKNTVVGFYTNDGDGWSKNWLSENLGPGDDAKMKFIEDGGKCNQLIRVGWLGKSGGEVKDDPIKINFCKATNVYLGDNEVTFD